MKKRHQSVSTRQLLWSASKVVISACVAIGVFLLLRLHFQSSTVDASESRVFADGLPFDGPPKIAFLFLARRDLPIDFLWGSFFESADVRNFSIYVHSAPGFVFDGSTTRSEAFYGRQLSRIVQVVWGESSMIEAERLLFEEALRDPANQRFVLLSDSCVPLYNFSFVYSYVMSSSRSFVDSFLDKKEGRYYPKMSPIIPQHKWRKGSQWVTLVRKHAKVIVDDHIILPVFRRYCKRRPPVDPSKGKQNLKLQKQHNCIPDEHYVQTLLAMNDLESELERRTLTYTLWNQSKTNMEASGWHPFTFGYANAGPKQIKEIKDINHVYYETEFRTEWCRTNSSSVPCFLFARKFSRSAAMRLLSDGILGTSDTAALLSNPS
ncbi:hypothetical protein Scep_028816 [Stephania cephalantha]|uniref:Core-2/I-branching beta-1,6-N-acetylglucosaminyltransferase family protein n=1 Tax=Stephania cephalantha TaxID=152367 RepID=A0AAP0EAP1_9MAGN